MSLQPFTLFSFNISTCGFVLVGPKIIIIIIITDISKHTINDKSSQRAHAAIIAICT